MPPSLYLINPKSDFPSYYSTEVYQVYGLSPSLAFADLATTTVAAMAPDDFEIEICEGNLTQVNVDHPADFIGITGKNTQFNSMKKFGEEFRKRGKIVIMGGPFASLEPEKVRPYCDILIEGEMEDIAEELFDDLRAGTWKDHYKGTQPDLRNSPIPRWDLYPNDQVRIGSVQTSRGCPFECEFCDVIVYLGRKQRHKEPDQVIAELDALYKYGYRLIFLSDDNFTVVRRRAKELLAELKKWNESRTQGHVTFITQLSIDAANDEEILRMCAEAGLTIAFVGIETPNEASLKETKKLQNLTNSKGTLLEKVNRFAEYGIMITAGMIVGFDNDGPDIFDMQFRFGMKTPIPMHHLYPLVAPAATPLYDRMAAAGRLVDWGTGGEATHVPWRTNIKPVLMSSDELIAGIKWLGNNLYSPKYFGERILNLIDMHGRALDKVPYQDTNQTNLPLRPVNADTIKLVRQFSRLGPEEMKVWKDVINALSKKPWLTPTIMGILAIYIQTRYMFEYADMWDQQLVDTKPNLEMISKTISSPEKILSE